MRHFWYQSPCEVPLKTLRLQLNVTMMALSLHQLKQGEGLVGQHPTQLCNLGNNYYNLIHNHLEADCYARAHPRPSSA